MKTCNDVIDTVSLRRHKCLFWPKGRAITKSGSSMPDENIHGRSESNRWFFCSLKFHSHHVICRILSPISGFVINLLIIIIPKFSISPGRYFSVNSASVVGSEVSDIKLYSSGFSFRDSVRYSGPSSFRRSTVSGVRSRSDIRKSTQSQRSLCVRPANPVAVIFCKLWLQSYQ